jgi:hypothetical protein
MKISGFPILLPVLASLDYHYLQQFSAKKIGIRKVLIG